MTPQTQLTRFNCVNCPNKIPMTRFLRKGCTCSDRCAKEIKDFRRKQREAKYCRLCCKPSTPEQRKAYREFAKAQPKAKRGRKPAPKPIAAAPKPAPAAAPDQLAHENASC